MQVQRQSAERRSSPLDDDLRDRLAAGATDAPALLRPAGGEGAGIDVSSSDTPPSIDTLNDEIDTLRQQGAPAEDPALRQALDERDTAIERLTGSSDAAAYDPLVAARAQRDGVTYNQAANDINATTKKLYDGQSPPPRELVESVRNLPWETPLVNARVDELMADGLGFEGAVVLAMTERNPVLNFGERRGPFNLFPSIDSPSLSGPWQDRFAGMVVDSAPEIEQWARSKNEQAITFTSGDDDVTVTRRDDGMIVVSDGDPANDRIIDPATTDRIVISTGAGSDRITVDESVTTDLYIAGGDGRDFIFGGSGNDIIDGGAGDDQIRGYGGSDIILGGDGDDNIEGGSGGDILLGGDDADVISGGSGNDIVLGQDGRDSLYGGRGEDMLFGGDDVDYLDGGRGRDRVDGGDGDDTLSGGKGDDRLFGGGGADTMIGASGRDDYVDAESGDTVIRESSDTESAAEIRRSGATVRTIEIDADAGTRGIVVDNSVREDGRDPNEFVDRVDDDLETLRATESGQAMLNQLDTNFDTFGERTTITELDGRQETVTINGRQYTTENGFAFADSRGWRSADGTTGTATGSTIYYNPSRNSRNNGDPAKPPVVVLFHELAHAQNVTSGTGVEGDYQGAQANNRGVDNAERQAVGLTVTIDHDGDPRTPPIERLADPPLLTENGLRTELGLDPRTQY